jgi:hypothetical protein
MCVKSIRGFALAAALPFFFQLSFVHAETEAVTFILTNGTEETIAEFYASPPSSDSWEDDILGVDVLESGDSVTITINDGREDCDYDFKAVFEDGSTLDNRGVTVCDGESYVYE